ncbi:MAG: MMPL family transporter [Myxococcales bacterium]|nr:MMPL family transporter [Myxococcales bacterium]
MNRERVGVALTLGMVLASAIYCVSHFRFSSDVTVFLPPHADKAQLLVSQVLAKSDLAQAMIIAVEGPDDESAAAASKSMAETLTAHPEVEWLHSGIDRDNERAFYETFFPARFGFLSDRPEDELEGYLSSAGLATAAKHLKDYLTTPMGQSSEMVTKDPLLAFYRHLERVQEARPSTLSLLDGQFLAPRSIGTQSPAVGVLFLGTKSSPFDSRAQQNLYDGINSAFEEINKDHGGKLQLLSSGVNRYALRAERDTRKDVQRISTISLLCTVLLLLAAFRSLRYILLVVVPVAFALASGLAACLLVFGSVHGMTLAFGATLVGVSVDYSIHFFNHHVQAPKATRAHKSLKAVWGGIVLGALTTVAGFVGMAWAGIEGMRQIAVFGSVGICGAVLTTRFLLPIFVPPVRRGVPWLGRASAVLSTLVTSLASRRRLLMALPLLVAALAAYQLPRIEWNDSPTALTDFDPEMVAEDERLRLLVSDSDPGRFVAAMGTTKEEALVRNDAAFGALTAATKAGELGGFRSLHQIIWSAELQERNLRVLWGTEGFIDRYREAFAAEGFVPEAFAEFELILKGERPAPLTWNGLEESGLLPLVRGLYAQRGKDVMAVNLLYDVEEPEAIRERLSAIKGVEYFDQKEYLESAYGGFRSKILEVVVLGLSAVLFLVFLRYRDWRLALAASIPAGVSALTTLSALSIAGVPLNLLHVLGLMLVLSMGVDYGVFVVESVKGATATGKAMVGTIVSALTTILSFGLLAMSANPALSALGATVAIGNSLSLVMTPLALVMLGLKHDREGLYVDASSS